MNVHKQIHTHTHKQIYICIDRYIDILVSKTERY